MKSSIPPPSGLPLDRIITTGEAAGLLGVALSTAQLWMESGAIKSWKTPGGHRRCRVSDVQAVVERHDGPGPVPAALVLGAEFVPAADAGCPTLACEAERLLALAHSRLIDSAPDARFDRLTWLATQITGAPMALVSLLTSQRQWFKARTGVEMSETPRNWAFCSHAILHAEGLIVPDALEDERFRDNVLVTSSPYIRFYAGLPICDAGGHRLGTLCVLDTAPRQLTAPQLRALTELVTMVSEEIARAGCGVNP